MQNQKGIKFWKLVNLAGSAIAMNLLFIVSCLPVITIGPAISGLYCGIRFMIRGDGWFAGYKQGFCQKFARNAAVGTIMGVWLFDTFRSFDIAYQFYLDGNGVSPLITYAIALIPPLVIFAALWPINVYFPYDFSPWLKKSVKLIFRAPIPVIVTAILWAVPVALVVYFPMITVFFALIFIAVYFSATVFISTILLKDALILQLLEYRAEHPESMEDMTDVEEAAEE